MNVKIDWVRKLHELVVAAEIDKSLDPNLRERIVGALESLIGQVLSHPES
jgi:hypothetical protein